MNPYSEIDVARGSTLIILITSSHFRMTHTQTPFPGHYEYVKSHWCSLAPPCPELAHNKTEKSSSLVEINKSIGEKRQVQTDNNEEFIFTMATFPALMLDMFPSGVKQHGAESALLFNFA